MALPEPERPLVEELLRALVLGPALLGFGVLAVAQVVLAWLPVSLRASIRQLRRLV
jgi:hypothetical protein